MTRAIKTQLGQTSGDESQLGPEALALRAARAAYEAAFIEAVKSGVPWLEICARFGYAKEGSAIRAAHLLKVKWPRRNRWARRVETITEAAS